MVDAPRIFHGFGIRPEIVDQIPNFELSLRQQSSLKSLQAHIALGQQITREYAVGDFGKWIYDPKKSVGTLYIPLPEGITAITYAGKLGDLTLESAQVYWIGKDERPYGIIQKPAWFDNHLNTRITCFYEPINERVLRIGVIGNGRLWFPIRDKTKGHVRNVSMDYRVNYYRMGFQMHLPAAVIEEERLYMDTNYVQESQTRRFLFSL